MLVTLANNQTISASSSSTWSYSPSSFQKLFMHLEDADWDDATLTVQIGSVTICNGVKLYGLCGYSQITSGAEVDHAGTNGYLTLDFGSHQCTDNANLYVTLTAGASQVDGVDVSAIVNQPSAAPPVKLTEYSDTTFTSDNNLMAMCWDAAKAAIDDDTNRIDIRNAVESSAPSFTSASSYYKSLTKTAKYDENWGILNINAVPLKTTYNYTANVVDRILTVEQMAVTRKDQSQARDSAKLVRQQAGK